MNINEDIRFEDFIISFKTVWNKIIICLAGAFLMFAIGIVLTWNSDVSNYYSSYVRLYSNSYGNVEESNDAMIIMNSYAEVITSSKVCERAASSLPQYGFSASEIADLLKVSSSDKVVIMIEATYTDPNVAEAVANAVAESFVIEMRNITGTNAVQILDSADGAGRTYSGFGRLWEKRMLFFAIGFVMVAGVIFVMELFSNKARLVEQFTLDEDDFILGIIPEADSKNGK
jgi:capsular polysaccharide biosynthesis protein